MNNMVISPQYKTAVELHQKIMITAQAAQQNLYDMCLMLKQMRDEKLYKELGYPNFEEYCENEVGMKHTNAYRYISVVENIKNVPSMGQIGITKLSLLASLSEGEQEEIRQRVNVEEVTVRGLKAEIERLKADRDSALRQVEELERRPVEVAVEEDVQARRENARLKAELQEAQKQLAAQESGKNPEQKNQEALIRQLGRDLSLADQEHANALERQRKQFQQEINRLNELLRRQAASPAEIPAGKEIFKAYYQNAIGAFTVMLKFMQTLTGEDRDFSMEKAGQLLRKLMEEVHTMEEE